MRVIVFVIAAILGAGLTAIAGHAGLMAAARGEGGLAQRAAQTCATCHH
jgi:hypothetical protein